MCDVGSGAGLPGIVLAIRRPGPRGHAPGAAAAPDRLPQRVVADLGLTASDGAAGAGGGRSAPRRLGMVTARAVAPLDRLVGWCAPAARPGVSCSRSRAHRPPTECPRPMPTLGRWGDRSRGPVLRGWSRGYPYCRSASPYVVARADDGLAATVRKEEPVTTTAQERAAVAWADPAPVGRRSPGLARRHESRRCFTWNGFT